MRLNFLKSPICLIAAPVILIVCGLQWRHVQAFQRLEWMTYDWRVQLAHAYASKSSNVATNLGMVEVSDNTIRSVNSGEFGYKFGLYWPRQVYARGLQELSREGAKAVAFDVILAERRPDQPGLTLPDGSMISSDDYFAQQLKNSGNAILAADESLLPDDLFKTNAWHVANITTERDADGVLRRDRAFFEYKDWHWIVKQMAAGYNLDLSRTTNQPGKITFYQMDGNPIVFPTDSKGMIDTTTVVNPVPPGVPTRFLPYQIARVWSMGIVLAAAQLKLDLDHPDIDLPGHRIVLHGENGLTRIIPVDSHGYFYIDWALGLKNDPNLAKGPFEDLLRAQQDRDAGRPVTNYWQDKLVVIGSTATGNDLNDMGVTALESPAYLVSKHWNVANSVITGRFVRTTSMPVNLLLIVVVGGLAAWITWVVARPVMGSVLMAGAAIVYLGVAVELFNHARIWLPIVLPLVCAGFVTHLSALTYRVTVEQSERKRVKSLFSRLVSPEVVNEVLSVKSISLDLEGQRKHITVYFADIRGFTELTDAAQAENTEFVRRNELSPQLAEDYFDEQAREVMRTISLYLSTIADCVKKYDGTLDKYIGDCVMAFWGAPLDNPRHALCAVRCAIEAQQALHALNATRQEENKRREQENFERLREGQPLLQTQPVLSMGSGINTGMTIAGFMGSEKHIVNYTVFGREVNLASRLEGVSGHGRIVIGEGTWAELQRDDPALAKACIELPPRAVKGFRDRVRTFEVPWKPVTVSDAPPVEPGKSDQSSDKPAALA